ncbi:Methyl jasmonate esterase 1 [Linum grandiflorum]
MEEDQKQRHFVLVHGACHGAWCWYKVVPLLEQAGHRVTALDLAASGIDRKQVSDVGSISEYHEPLMEFMESVKEQVVLVGHSMGGLGISVAAMERFPDKVCVGVFVSATMPSPHPGLPYSALMQKVLEVPLLLPTTQQIHNCYDINLIQEICWMGYRLSRTVASQ